MAPSSKRSTGWEFIIIEEKEKLEKLSYCKEFGAKPIAGAAMAVVVLADPLKSDVWIEDASIASILMQLQAEDYIREMLGIPYQIQVLSVITFGHKNEERKPFDEEKTMWEKVHIDKL